MSYFEKRNKTLHIGKYITNQICLNEILINNYIFNACFYLATFYSQIFYYTLLCVEVKAALVQKTASIVYSSFVETKIQVTPKDQQRSESRSMQLRPLNMKWPTRIWQGMDGRKITELNRNGSSHIQRDSLVQQKSKRSSLRNIKSLFLKSLHLIADSIFSSGDMTKILPKWQMLNATSFSYSWHISEIF